MGGDELKRQGLEFPFPIFSYGNLEQNHNKELEEDGNFLKRCISGA